MAKITTPKETVAERETRVARALMLENQIRVLESRIVELEQGLMETRDEDQPYHHRANSVHESTRRTPQQIEELEDIVLWWINKTHSKSLVLEKIEDAPLKLRDKLLMAMMLGTLSAGGPGGGPSFSLAGPQELMDMLRKFGGG